MIASVGATLAFGAGPMDPTVVALLGTLLLLPLIAAFAVVCWFHGRFVFASACALALVYAVQSWNPEVVPMQPCFFCGVASVPFGGFFFAGGSVAVGYGILRRIRGGEVTAIVRVRARLRALSLTLAVLVLGALVGRGLQAGLLPGARLEPFDATLWHAEDSAPPGSSLSHRARMLHDLVDRVLPGAARSEVLQLLGEDLWPQRRTLLAYTVDPHPLQGHDQDLLVVEFDQDELFQAAWIETR